ncbi:MAG: hypothetical protein LAO56_09920 [Acidobacteriia bacterium]|nr:hypothetical protein [Terriglobia bacterium]
MVSPEPIAIEKRSLLGYVASFILHTYIAYICALDLSPQLVFHWFGWIAPILQISISIPATDWYLQHFELTTILPALVVGYVNVVRFFPATVRSYLHEGESGSIAGWAWILLTVRLLYKMLMYHAPSSVLIGTSVTTIGYFFDIQKVMPTFADPLASDPVRVWAQMSITAPFYAGVSYSLGALASKRQLLTKFFTFEKHGETTTPQQP